MTPEIPVHAIPRDKLELHEIKSRRLFTQVVDEEAMARSLAAETDRDLLIQVRKGTMSLAWADSMFGGNARRWSNYVKKELNRRGITEMDSETLFGEPIKIPIKPWA